MQQKKSSSDRRAQFESPAPGAARSRALPFVLVAVLLVSLVGVIVFRSSSSSSTSQVTAAPSAAGSDVVLDAAQFEDGKARFFTYPSATGREIRFFVIKSADGVLRAALDSCDVCYKERKGYRQVGDTMVCNNCEMAFPSDQINVMQGGCNPAPLDRRVVDGQVVVSAASLEQGTFYF